MFMIQEGVTFDFGYWTVKPGLEDFFLEKWQKFAQWTLNHYKGIRWVYMVRDQERSNEFISFAPWDSPKSIAEWRQSSKYIAAVAELKDLCEGIEPGTMIEVTHVKR
ncbi:MAG TPA: antibiotic biosynthesis monooxygenase [Methanoregulaceae archaeon]|nr:MAG: antibiotic biosynthesis monooxygenase [Methanolinea sp.]HON82199.1 antibiotic biosynthesis monooxygenase [Methanoregulaceae archaeon]HPD10943.1 antibiotic biosynthesis monooxygenase [Methanoregulaceae archaeon]HRT16085.1 antibiotic biosynthesis monooxygenase [Methanoregulaceae archaeon]HRU31591.1 antibiotic biosynthesis monooxygenase [Methanoregulaceae archaeon]